MSGDHQSLCVWHFFFFQLNKMSVNGSAGPHHDIKASADSSALQRWSNNRSHKKKNLWYLVFVGPEGADGQLHLVPLFGVRARRVPHRVAQRSAVDPDVRPQRPRAVAITAVQEVAELDAVRVVLAQGLQQQLSAVAHGVLGGVHQHVWSWRGGGEDTHRLFMVWYDAVGPSVHKPKTQRSQIMRISCHYLLLNICYFESSLSLSASSLITVFALNQLSLAYGMKWKHELWQWRGQFQKLTNS